MKSASILIVEDDPQQLRQYAKALRGYRLTCVNSATPALEHLEHEFPDLILLDHVLADGELGTDFLPLIKKSAAHIPVIMISGTLDIKEQLKALSGDKAAHFVLEKPVDIEELISTVEQALNNCGMGETIEQLRSLERAEKIESNEPERRFTERLARQHTIANRLRESSEVANVSALAREFNVARRTIQRDLKDLVVRGQIDAALLPGASIE